MNKKYKEKKYVGKCCGNCDHCGLDSSGPFCSKLKGDVCLVNVCKNHKVIKTVIALD